MYIITRTVLSSLLVVVSISRCVGLSLQRLRTSRFQLDMDDTLLYAEKQYAYEWP